MKSSSYWIEKLQLQKHPEGGWFREIYRSRDVLEDLPARFSGSRNASTSIYYLLEKKDVSHFHRIQSDEIWHYYAGSSSIRIYCINQTGSTKEYLVGPDFEKEEQFQVVIPAGCWFAAELTNPDGYGLIGCTVAPGFDFADFEMAKRDDLLHQFPRNEEIIIRLTDS